MNKTSKFILGGIAAFSLNAVLSNMFNKKQPVVPVTPNENTTDTKTTTKPVKKVANPGLMLLKGSKGYEVQLLQQKLSVTADGSFGSLTETALFNVTGLKQITLQNLDAAVAAYTKIKNMPTKAQITAAFPLKKTVIATTKFAASITVWRNGGWFNSDLNGRPLPSITFNPSAQVGYVFDYDVVDPTVIIIYVNTPQTIQSGYSLPRDANFQKVRVKSTWIK